MHIHFKACVAVVVTTLLLGWCGPGGDVEACRRRKKALPRVYTEGLIEVEGHIVAADVPSSSQADFVFGKATRRPQPAYPQMARARGATGRVVIIASVSSTGEVTGLDVRSPTDKDLNNAALSAVKGWLFTPTTANGSPVPAYAQVVMRFY